AAVVAGDRAAARGGRGGGERLGSRGGAESQRRAAVRPARAAWRCGARGGAPGGGGPLLRAPRRAGILAPGAARPRERAGAAAGDRGGPRGCAGRGAMNAAIEAQAELLRARSFAIFPGLYSPPRVARLRAGLLELYHRL